MNFIFKNFISYFLISLLSTLIFIGYLDYKGYPGGEVGMAPLLMMLNCVITITVSIIVILLIKIITQKELSLIKNSWIFTLTYFLSLVFFFGSNPFKNYDNEIYKNVDLWSYLCVIISLLLMNTILLTRKNLTYK